MYMGINYPGTAVNENTGTGTGWTNPNNIKAADGVSATGDLSGGGYSTGGLIATNFGFNVPSIMVITGIKLEIKRTGAAALDQTVQLRKISSNVGIDVSGQVANGTLIKGGDGYLFGTSFTPAEVNASTFGVYYAAKNTSGGGSIAVDYIRLTVYFALPNKPFDASIRKRYDARVTNSSGTYKGFLPNVYDNFEFTDEINTAGSDTTIMLASTTDTARTDMTSPLLAEDGSAITTEDGQALLVENSTTIVGVGQADNIVVNGNTVVVYEYSPYYPNGFPVFRGKIDKWTDQRNTLSINLKSDGQDLDNTELVGPPYNDITDQINGFPPNSVFPYMYTNTGAGTYAKTGQTFTVGNNAPNLGSISVMLSCAVGVTTSSTTTLKVYSDSSATNLLGSTSLKANIYNPGGGWQGQMVKFSLYPRIATSPGQQLFFGLENDGTDTVVVTSANETDYVGGESYIAVYSGGSGGGNYFRTSGLGEIIFSTASSYGVTIVSYGKQDPSTGMLTRALADYNTGGGLITAGTIAATGISVPYAFNLATMLEAINKFLDLSPANFYWYVDRGRNTLDFRGSSATVADFTLIRGRHISDLQVTPTTEQLKNYVFFSGGEIAAVGSSTPQPGSGINLYKIYKDDVSIAQYGKRIDRISDNRVTDQSTADAYGGSALAAQKDEKYIAQVEVLDRTMDISLLKPGKMVTFAGHGNYKDKLVLQIVRRSYMPRRAILTLGVLPIRQTETVEKLTRELLAQQTIANPASAS